MTDLFHRLNPFRPPSPTKAPRHSSPTRKRTKSPHDLSINTEGEYAPSRPSSSLESPLPDIPNGRYLIDTQRSLDLDRPVFAPVPPSPAPSSLVHQPVTPGRKGKTPSILRSLAHHPSLSALKTKSKVAKAKRDDAYEEDREERLSGSVDEEVPDNEERRGWMGTWGSGKKKGRKGSLKAVKSMPSGLRSSEDSSDFRPSIDVPVPAVPEMYVKRDSKGIDFSKARTPDIEISLEGYETPVSPTRGAGNPSPIRRRGTSEDLSPTRRRLSPRHLSTPASATISPRPSPPRFSLPATTQHPHPVPLWPRPDSITEYDPESYGDRPVTPDQLRDGLDLMRPDEALPQGTPGGTKEDLRRGVLIDGVRPGKDAVRFFSRDTYARLSESPSTTPSPASTPCPTPTPGLLSTLRAESPFEVKLSPLVTKRMSLDAFGPTTLGEKRNSTQSVPESIEEMADEADDDVIEVAESTPVKLDLVQTLEGWTGTQLTTIDESPASARDFALVQGTPASVAAGIPGTGRTVWFTPDSGSDATALVRRQSVPSPVTSISRQLIQAHMEHTRSLDTQVRESETTIDALRAEVDELRSRLDAEEKENEAAWQVVTEQKTEVEAAEAKVEEKHQALESMRAAMEENEEFFDQLQEAHDELTDRCKRLELDATEAADKYRQLSDRYDALTRGKDDLALRLACAEKEKSDLALQLQQTQTALSAKIEECHESANQMSATVEEYTSHMTTCDAQRAQTTMRLAGLDTLKSLITLRESEVENGEMTIAELRAEIVGWQTKLAGREVLLQQLRDKVASKQYEMDEMRVKGEAEEEDMKARVVQLERERAVLGSEYDSVHAALAVAEEKLAQNAGRVDENERLSTQLQHTQQLLLDAQRQIELGEMAGDEVQSLQAKVAQFEEEQADLEAEHANVQTALANANDELSRKKHFEEEIEHLASQVQQLETLLAQAQHHIEAAQSDLEARAGDMSLQQGEVEQLRAELEAEQEAIQRVTAQSARDQREHERVVSDLRWSIDELRTQLADQEGHIRTAFVDRAMSSASTADAQSRISTYLGEVDRLKVSEAKLQSDLSDLRHVSSGDTLKIAELEKRIKELEEDKELLDISLDNKQTEITLLHRQASRSGTGARSVTPTRKRLTASTSRVPSTPSTRPDTTPMPDRRLSSSMHNLALARPGSAASAASASAIKAGRRESSVLATPVTGKFVPALAGSTPGLSRRPSITTPTPASRSVLGSTTRHNRTESKIPTVCPRKSTAAATEKPGLRRQTSLPSLARATSVSRSGQRPLDGMAEVDEVEG